MKGFSPLHKGRGVARCVPLPLFVKESKLGNEAPKPVGVPGKVKGIKQLKFARVLAVAGLVGSVATIYESCPFDGYIKQVTIHWPDGSDALVDVAVAHSNTVFCPRGQGNYLALNDATPTYFFNENVEQHEEVWVEMRNRDGGNEHAITITVSIEER